MIWAIAIAAFLIVVGCYKAEVGHTGVGQVILGLIALPFMPAIIVLMVVFYTLKLIGGVLFCKWD